MRLQCSFHFSKQGSNHAELADYFKANSVCKDFDIAGSHLDCADVLHRAARLNFRMLAAAEGYSPAKILNTDVQAADFNGQINLEFLERYEYPLNGKSVDPDDEFLLCSSVVEPVGRSIHGILWYPLICQRSYSQQRNKGRTERCWDFFLRLMRFSFHLFVFLYSYETDWCTPKSTPQYSVLSLERKVWEHRWTCLCFFYCGLGLEWSEKTGPGKTKIHRVQIQGCLWKLWKMFGRNILLRQY